jgi:hypothetical protein
MRLYKEFSEEPWARQQVESDNIPYVKGRMRLINIRFTADYAVNEFSPCNKKSPGHWPGLFIKEDVGANYAGTSSIRTLRPKLAKPNQSRPSRIS